MDEREELKLLIHRLGFLRSTEKTAVLDRLDRLREWERLTHDDLTQWLGRPVRAQWDGRVLRRQVTEDRRFLARSGCWVLHNEDPRFPALLREIADPPWMLWGRGELPEPGPAWVAVVGTRSPSERAKTAAREFGREVARKGVVVSGLARGIDAFAHWGAIETGPTVAVLGHGIDGISPSSNRPLAGRILASGGALVTEYGPGEPALPWRFVARNRLISGLCRTVMVIEAPARSGALITADFALDQGRDVVVHADGLHGERGTGTRTLVRQGAVVLTGAEGLEDVWSGTAVGQTAQIWFEGMSE